MVKEKGLKEFLKEDEALKRKITYDEFNSVKQGFGDNEIESTYQNYREIVDKNKEI